MQIKLRITVGIKYPRFGRFTKPSLQSAAISQIGMIVYGFDLLDFLRQSIRNFAGFISTTVIDDNDFKIRTDPLQHFQRSAGCILYVGFFVITGEEYADGKRRFLRLIDQ